MKTVYIHNILWSHYKGAVLNEVDKLVKSDNSNQFKVIHLCENQKKRKNLGSIDYSFHKYDYEVLLKDEYLENLSYYKTYMALKKKLLELDPDCIVFSGLNHVYFWPLFFSYKKSKVKVIIEFNSVLVGKKRGLLKEKIKRIILNRADAVMCYGTLHKQYLKSLGFPSDKIFFKTQATDNATLEELYKRRLNQVDTSNNSDNLRLLYVGRLSQEKNLFKLLNAYRSIQSSHKIELVLIGDGPQKEELVNFILRNDIRNVTFTGSMGWQEIVDYYAAADVFVLPSNAETWGLVVNEAMMCRLPVLVSHNCGCSADLVFEGENGYTFNPNSVDDLANKILMMVNQRSQLTRMGEKSYDIIQDFTPMKAAKQFLECIYSVQ